MTTSKGLFSAAVNSSGAPHFTLLTGSASVSAGAGAVATNLTPGTAVLGQEGGAMLCVDLTTGQVIKMTGDGIAEPQAASATQLAQAAGLLQAAVAAMAADGGVNGEAAQVLAAVNVVLAANNVAAVTVPATSTSGGAGTTGGSGPGRDTVVSPESP